MGLVFIIIQVSRWRPDTPQSVGLIWNSDRPLNDNTQHSQAINIHAPGGIRTRNPSKRAVAYPRLRPPFHRDRHIFITDYGFYCWLILLYHICILLESLNNTTVRRGRSPTTILWEAIITSINDDPDRTNRVESNTARANCFSPQSVAIRGRGWR